MTFTYLEERLTAAGIPLPVFPYSNEDVQVTVVDGHLLRGGEVLGKSGTNGLAALIGGHPHPHPQGSSMLDLTASRVFARGGEVRVLSGRQKTVEGHPAEPEGVAVRLGGVTYLGEHAWEIGRSCDMFTSVDLDGVLGETTIYPEYGIEDTFFSARWHAHPLLAVLFPDVPVPTPSAAELEQSRLDRVEAELARVRSEMATPGEEGPLEVSAALLARLVGGRPVQLSRSILRQLLAF